MKIAIVGPSPVPFEIGGMEYLLLGLQSQINSLTEHKAELIKLPTKENNLWDLINSYKQFYELNLDHFDMVIITKYPAWMVQHHNKVSYMAHRLRGLYDTYHFMRLPDHAKRNNPLVNQILDYIGKKESNVEGLFVLLDDLYQNRDKVPSEHIDFPSPFAKGIITFLDNKGMEGCKRNYAISKTVKSRKEYFVPNANVEVVYPPSFLPYFENKNSDYLFTISRLDNAKRISLMIEAMKLVKSDIKLKIAGSGPQEKELKQLAAADGRIEFLGFVNDNEAIEYYSNAKAVIYIPYEEDYGLVTIEAMMSNKPVITCYDSGGTVEFVEDNVTGFISQSSDAAIAGNIDRLANLSQEELKRMGENCFNKVKDITWENVVKKLVGSCKQTSSGVDKPRVSKRKKIAVTSTFPIYPPQGGGQARIYSLYKKVGQYFDVEIVSFTNVDQSKFCDTIAPNVIECRVPKSVKHQEEESKLEKNIGIPITDVVMPLVSKYTPDYGGNLKKAIDESDIVVVSHPFLMHEVRNYIGDKPFIYEAHNVEYLMKKKLFGNNKNAAELLETTYKIEEECCKNSSFIMACSDEDKEQLCELYHINEDKVIVIPNGVDTSFIRYTDMQTRMINQRKMDIRNQKIGMFMGSWHPPNLEACEHIFEIAKKCPDVIFLLMGSQCLYFQNREVPSNVGMLGVVSEEVKSKVFEVVNFALNPMTSGSGTNLKMFDYMAAGIPIISTEFGTRGIDKKDGFIISTIEDMPEAIRNFEVSNLVDVNINRNYVEEYYDWNSIGEKLVSKIVEILD